MKVVLHLITICICLVLATLPVQAQDASASMSQLGGRSAAPSFNYSYNYSSNSYHGGRDLGSIGIFMAITSPDEALDRTNYRNGFGFGLDYLSPRISNRGPLGLQLGVRADFVWAGRERNEIWPINEVAPFDLIVRNQQIGIYGVSRISTSDRLPVQLYAEGQLGTRIFGVVEEISFDDWDTDDNESFWEETTWTLSYGVGVGTLIRVGPNVQINLRYLRLFGTQADHVDLDSVESDGEQVSYFIDRSGTSQHHISVGVHFNLFD